MRKVYSDHIAGTPMRPEVLEAMHPYLKEHFGNPQSFHSAGRKTNAAVEKAREKGLVTGCITCNLNSKLAEAAEFPIEVVVGPEFVTGSTRMKSGTAQKLVLNMISTALMIRIGRVKGNKMVNMQLSNNKLVNRGTRYLMEELGLNYEEAEKTLKEYGSVRRAIEAKKTS